MTFEHTAAEIREWTPDERDAFYGIPEPAEPLVPIADVPEDEGKSE